MSKAKRMKEDSNAKGFSKIAKFFIIVLVLIVITFGLLFYLIKTNKIAFLSRMFDNIKFSDAESTTTSSIESDNPDVEANTESNGKEDNSNNNTKSDDSNFDYSKNIKGLDDLKILNVSVDNSTKLSVINISLENISNKKINSKKCHLYFVNGNNKIIFGSSIKTPEIDANSKKDFKIICGDTINDYSYYKIELENTKK